MAPEQALQGRGGTQGYQNERAVTDRAGRSGLADALIAGKQVFVPAVRHDAPSRWPDMLSTGHQDLRFPEWQPAGAVTEGRPGELGDAAEGHSLEGDITVKGRLAERRTAGKGSRGEPGTAIEDCPCEHDVAGEGRRLELGGFGKMRSVEHGVATEAGIVEVGVVVEGCLAEPALTCEGGLAEISTAVEGRPTEGCFLRERRGLERGIAEGHLVELRGAGERRSGEPGVCRSYAKEVEVDEGGIGEIQAHVGPEFRADRLRCGLTLVPVDTQVISEDALRSKTHLSFLPPCVANLIDPRLKTRTPRHFSGLRPRPLRRPG